MSKRTYPDIAAIFGLPAERASAADIRSACKDLVSRPGKFQALSPEDAYYWMLSDEYGEPVMTADPDDFEIWRSGTLAFACVTDDLGFATVKRFDHVDAKSAAAAWVEDYYDNGEADDYYSSIGSHVDPADMSSNN